MLLAFCVPSGVVFAFYSLGRISERKRVFSLSLMLLSVPHALASTRSTWSNRCKPASPAYTSIQRLLAKDAIIITSNPWQFSFHTRMRSVATPYSAKQSTIQATATRYDASYLAVIDDDIRNRVKKLLKNELSVASKVYSEGHLVLYKINRIQG